jgi:MFS family permease
MLTQMTWTAARASWLPLAILLAVVALFLPGQRSLVLPVLLVTAFVAAAFAGVGNVTWYGWLAHLIPSDQRGTFLAQRAQWLSFASLLSLPIVGLILDRSRLVALDGLGFAVVLASSGVCAVLGWRLLSAVPAATPPPVATGKPKIRHHRGAISSERLALYTGVWQVAVYLSAPFFQAYSIARLGMSFSVLTDLQVLAQIIPILTLGLWGRVVDRIGLRLPLALCSLGKGVVPICYLLASREVWWPIILVNVLSVLDAGITVANAAAFAHMADSPHGAARIAHLNVLISVAASITPIVAGVLVAQRQIGGIEVLLVLFVLSGVGRAASGIILLLPERPRRRRVIRSTTGVPAPEVG